MAASENHIATLLEHFGPPLLQSLAAVIIAWLAFYLITRGLGKLSSKGLIPSDLRRILQSLIKWLILIVLLLVVLGLFGNGHRLCRRLEFTEQPVVLGVADYLRPVSYRR